MDSVGLLIQGPMISKGRTGADPYDPVVVEVDTVSDVRATIDEARAAGFSPIVLSTWAGQPGTAEAEEVKGLDRFLALPDPIPCPAYEAQQKKDNRIRQTFGCLEGVRALGAVSYAARVRTDQRLDLGRLLEATRQSRPGELRVLGIRRGRPAHLQDFVVAGPLADVVGHYEGLASCDWNSFHVDHHYDMFLKDAYGQLNKQVEPSAFFPRRRYLLEVQVPMFRRMFQRLRPLPDAFARSVVWRGRPYSDEYFRSRMVLEDEWTSTGREAALASLSGPGVKLTRFNRAYFVDVERMAFLGLIDRAEASRGRQFVNRVVGAAGVRLRRPVHWS